MKRIIQNGDRANERDKDSSSSQRNPTMGRLGDRERTFKSSRDRDSMSFTSEDKNHCHRENKNLNEQKNLEKIKEMFVVGVGVDVGVRGGGGEELKEISSVDKRLGEQREREGEKMREENCLLNDWESAVSLEMKKEEITNLEQENDLNREDWEKDE
jgi:hypothetical protein